MVGDGFAPPAHEAACPKGVTADPLPLHVAFASLTHPVAHSAMVPAAAIRGSVTRRNDSPRSLETIG